MPQGLRPVKAAQYGYAESLSQSTYLGHEEEWDHHHHEQWATGSQDLHSASPSSSGKAYTHNREVSHGSQQRIPSPVKRKPVSNVQHSPAPEVRIQEMPMNSVHVSPPQMGIVKPEHGALSYAYARDDEPRHGMHTYDPSLTMGDSTGSLPVRTKAPNGYDHQPSYHTRAPSRDSSNTNTTPRIEEDGEEVDLYNQDPSQGLQYHAFEDGSKKQTQHGQNRASHSATKSTVSSSSGGEHSNGGGLHAYGPRTTAQRPVSSYILGQEMRGRTLSPMSAVSDSQGHGRDLSTSRRSPLSRPASYVDLLNNLPYSQQVAPGGPLNNAGLQSVVGNAASLLDTKKTLDMYRANVKKTTDAAVQYEFAIFMINAARDLNPEDGIDPSELTNEAKQILQRLADRAYPFAQYYLADGFSSGLFNKGKPDLDKSFSLFVNASKHGHAEAGYRAALCYEFGWGCAKSPPKAVQFYRNSASKNHPGAATRLGLACISGDMGLKDKYREGVKWLKRAQESADPQYNAGPYELGIMHLKGHGELIFKDEAYAAQLLTQSAEMGHVHANFLMGQAYENGLYGCPRDAALSVHFYNGAATRGHAEGQMALCAWYMIGAEPVLERDENEAYAWAKQAAESGFAKAEYTVGYFTEMGIGCRRDPLEANVWYVRAADQGNETAKQRLAIIHAASSGDPGIPMSKVGAKSKDLAGKKKFMGIF